MEEIRMRRVLQLLDRSRIENIPGEIAKEFDRIRLRERIKPGMQIGIPVGSRGIANLPIIIKSIIAEVNKYGGVPFILPSMGSHGGAISRRSKEGAGPLWRDRGDHGRSNPKLHGRGGTRAPRERPARLF